MGELINTEMAKRNFHGQLLATVSGFALLSLVTITGAAQAGGDDRPTVWIELGGQFDRLQNSGERFTPAFIANNADAGVFNPESPIDTEAPPRFSYGGEGRLVLAPHGSSWEFSIAARYGRVGNKKYHHEQSQLPPIPRPPPNTSPLVIYPENFSETFARNSENHLLLDFQVGHDVGLGLFANSSATVNFGVRMAQFSSRSSAKLYGRPDIHVYNQYDAPKFQVPPFPTNFPGLEDKYLAGVRFHAYTALGQASRSFHGLGPSLSFNGSTPVAGNAETSQLSVDWGVNGAVLFGRQKVDVNLQTSDRYLRTKYQTPYPDTLGYKVTTHDHQRKASRSVVVPNIGGFAGISFRQGDAKVSLGYRADFFFGAIDGGIDTPHRQTVSFHGPFAKISVGLGD